MYTTTISRTDKQVIMDEERGLIRKKKVGINYLIGSVVMAQGTMALI